VYDPDPAAELFLTTIVEEAVEALEQLGHFEKSSFLEKNLKETLSRITFTTDLIIALDKAEIVQENGPEDMSCSKRSMSY
jgi:3-hydroxyacyl-CoA dehydrogenase